MNRMYRRFSTHLLTPTLTQTEEKTFNALHELAPMFVAGGWVRDKLLESMNPVAGQAWQDLRTLAGHPPGDVDVLVEDISARDFYKLCEKHLALSVSLRARPFIVRAKGGRLLDTVKLRMPHHNVDVTSLKDAKRIFAHRAAQRMDPESPATSRAPLEQTLTIDKLDALEQDAGHRDLSFNALYYSMSSKTVLDPSGKGTSDLKQGVARIPHPQGAFASIREDPLRLFRAYRFAARYDFQLDDGCWHGLGSHTDVHALLQCVSRGRILNEVKKALLLHNRPANFLRLICGPGKLHEFLLGDAGQAVLNAWDAGVGRVGRLEPIIIEGLRRGTLRSKSSAWRGRELNSKQAALFAPDWRKTGIWENDWAELLLAALLWNCDVATIKQVGQHLELSQAMVQNIVKLVALSRQGLMSAQTAPLGAYLLHSAATTTVSPQKFWDSCPTIIE